MQYIFLALTFILSAVIGAFYLPRVVEIAKKKQLFDSVSNRNSHTGQIPRVGGITFIPIIVLSFFLSLGLYVLTQGNDIIINFSETLLETSMLVAGMAVIYMIGFVDDLIGSKYRLKFVVQFFSAIVMVLSGVCVCDFVGVFGFNSVHPIIGGFVTVVIITTIVNAYNLIDGIDGLCTSLSMLAITVLGVWFFVNGFFLYALLSSSFLGVLIVFFFFNTGNGKNKLFMGDTGSMLLGYLISFLGLKFFLLNNTPTPDIIAIENPAVVFLGIIFIPVFDLFRVFIFRMSQKKSPFAPDKEHLHHKLVFLGLKHTQCSLIVLLFQVLFMVFNYSIRGLNINVVILSDIILGIIIISIIDFLIRKKKRASVSI